jgi:hypothetical protein
MAIELLTYVFLFVIALKVFVVVEFGCQGLLASLILIEVIGGLALASLILLE